MTVHPYPALARLALENYFKEESVEECLFQLPQSPELWAIRRACFVSIKKEHDGSLRGCIGTIMPVQESIGQEIIANAISAGIKDPRFKPLSLKEMDVVVFSVDVLESPTSVSGLDELDPEKWGVIVTKGARRGVLLPRLDGVDTAIKQVSIAAQKAGLSSLEGISLERFGVMRYPENGGNE